MVNYDELESKVHDQADFLEVNISHVERAETAGDGMAVKVIGVDGETEADQVGFTVAHPGTPRGSQMFNNKLKAGLQNLRSYMRGDQDDGDDTDEDEAEAKDRLEELAQQEQSGTARVAETSAEDPRSDGAQPGARQPRQPADPDLTLELTIDEESMADLEAELDEIADQGDRIDDLEARIETIEDVFGQLGG